MSYQPPASTQEERRRVEANRRRFLHMAHLLNGDPLDLDHQADLVRSDDRQPSSSQNNEPYLPPYAPSSSSQPKNELPNEAKIKLCSPKYRHWVKAITKLDTGADDNWISPSIAERLGAEIVTGPTVTYSTFWGDKLVSSKIVKNVAWYIVGIESSSKTDFRLAGPHSPFEVLLGRESIESEKIYTVHKDALVLTRVPETQEQKQARENMEKKVAEEAKMLEIERKSVAQSSAQGSARQQHGKAKPNVTQERGSSNQEQYDEMDCD